MTVEHAIARSVVVTEGLAGGPKVGPGPAGAATISHLGNALADGSRNDPTSAYLSGDSDWIASTQEKRARHMHTLKRLGPTDYCLSPVYSFSTYR